MCVSKNGTELRNRRGRGGGQRAQRRAERQQAPFFSTPSLSFPLRPRWFIVFTDTVASLRQRWKRWNGCATCRFSPETAFRRMARNCGTTEGAEENRERRENQEDSRSRSSPRSLFLFLCVLGGSSSLQIQSHLSDNDGSAGIDVEHGAFNPECAFRRMARNCGTAESAEKSRETAGPVLLRALSFFSSASSVVHLLHECRCTPQRLS